MMAGIGCAYGAESPTPCTVFPWQSCAQDSGVPLIDANRADRAADGRSEATGHDASDDGTAPEDTGAADAPVGDVTSTDAPEVTPGEASAMDVAVESATDSAPEGSTKDVSAQ